MGKASFTCPQCGSTSHNPNDARESYCAACHRFYGPDDAWWPPFEAVQGDSLRDYLAPYVAEYHKLSRRMLVKGVDLRYFLAWRRAFFDAITTLTLLWLPHRLVLLTRRPDA